MQVPIFQHFSALHEPGMGYLLLLKNTSGLQLYLCPLFNFCFLFAGISGKSQILFSIVYTARYLDLLTTYISVYNTAMKVFFIVASFATVYLMYVKFRATYDHNHDTFRIEFLLVPSAILALMITRDYSPLEVSKLYNITYLVPIFKHCFLI